MVSITYRFSLYTSPPTQHLPSRHLGKFDVNSFADRLWGDIYFDADTRKFTRKQADAETPRTFVHFVLEQWCRAGQDAAAGWNAAGANLVDEWRNPPTWYAGRACAPHASVTAS